MKQTEAAREAANLPHRRPDLPDYVPAERPDDQDGFDEAMRVGLKGIGELLERRRKKP